jgi:hypothetical protein
MVRVRFERLVKLRRIMRFVACTAIVRSGDLGGGLRASVIAIQPGPRC